MQASTDFIAARRLWPLALVAGGLGVSVMGAGGGTTRVLDAGPAHRTVEAQRVVYPTNGVPEVRVSRYTELGDGLNFFDETSREWLPTEELIELRAEGAAAVRGPHKVWFSGNVNDGDGTVTFVGAAGEQLRSSILALGYFDPGSGVTHYFGLVQDAGGELVAPNQLLYRDAFEGIRADVLYIYSRTGLEQDVVLREEPPSPETFGLDGATVQLVAVTEFFEAPQPEVRSRGEAGTVFVDETLEFPSFRIDRGKAFGLERDETQAVPVRKRWRQVEGRTILIEAVDYTRWLPELRKLPAAREGAAIPGRRRGNALAGLPVRNLSLPEPSLVIARAEPPQEPGAVLDYVTVGSGLTNYVFAADQTYYVSGTTTLYTSAIFEGGAVIKYSSSTNAKLLVPDNTTVNFQGGLYRPVVFTAKDDDRVGEVIDGSSGDPTSGYYANPALSFDNDKTARSVRHFRISHARTGIGIVSDDAEDQQFWHGQFHRCQQGISVSTDPVYLYNILFSNVGTNLVATSSTLLGEHITAHSATWFFKNNGSATLSLKNSLLAAVANAGSYSATVVSNVASGSGVFWTYGGGAHYLSDYYNPSVYDNKGTTGINAQLAADLKLRTTMIGLDYPYGSPFAPWTTRDTDTPNLGYHYDPIDYLISSHAITTGDPLEIQAGTVVAFLAGCGFSNSDELAVAGTPKSPVWLTRAANVQEDPALEDSWWYYGCPTGDWLIKNGLAAGGGYGGNADLRFAKFALLSGGGRHLWMDATSGQVRLRDSELYGGKVDDPALHAYPHTNIMANNVFYRTTLNFGGATPAGDAAGQLDVSNLLLRYCSVNLAANPRAIWFWRDSVFDRCTLTQSGGLAHGYNSYYSSGRLSPAMPTDGVLGGISFGSGTLGTFYLSGNSTLINTGSRSAGSAGLYHHTIYTAQTKEGASLVDRGFHYVALNGSGNPVDSDSDGTPDYLEDPTGAAAISGTLPGSGNGPTQPFTIYLQQPRNGSVLP